MESKIKRILKKFEDNGFEAYIVGGYVRDHLLNIETNDIDICTNALPKDVIKIFNIKTANLDYGSISIKDSNFTIDITTYRQETEYQNRKPLKVQYVNNLLSDIKRRDFTINSLCMNSNDQIIDLLDGKSDIDKKIIKVIGDTNAKFLEDPLRILRAIRFATILDFDLDEKISDFIKSNKEVVGKLSYYRRQEELNKIFASKNITKGLQLIKDFGLEEILEIKYDKIVIIPDILGIWAQIDFTNNYVFPKESKLFINKIRSIVLKGKIDNYILYEYDLYPSLVAGEILGYLKEDISKMYANMPIKIRKDIAITADEIITILNIDAGVKLKTIFEDLTNKILSGTLSNENLLLKEYIKDNWK